MRTIRIGKAAEQLNITSSTLRKYADQGLIEFEVTPNGQRVFTQEAINKFKGVTEDRVIVFYVRSSSGDKGLIASQVTALEEIYGLPAKVFADKGSGLSEKRKQLNQMLDQAAEGKFNTICVTQKDRLTRFGFSYLERHLKSLNIQIMVLGESESKSLSEELMQDFMSLLASFSGKFYRLRGYEQQKQLLNTAGERIEEQEIN